ncbi:hypothetical protein Asppvi_010827 [Aspergillus pseudoviridinutans]|uniref:Leucine-rich repeat domain-containing protein n=1 Tax=Aspergillus pseudoviridinutans TaxID=1517512 RepID=A0A9P3EZV0_9EURO|nr:uncharacterized protein Asppvi_010827 [Aspergillus pseudoviridinutans]GIJ91852.1 hypothetical protein Asppvi_010827 [Aspergillus pseudoviridinutans]
MLSTPFNPVELPSYRPGTTEIEEVSQLLYAIVQCPEIASLVRVLQLGAWQTVLTREYGDHPDEFHFDHDLVEKLVREATSDKERQEKWIKDLEQGVTDPWLALLIPRLTYLRKISFVWAYGADYVSTMLVEAAEAENSVFPYLEEVWAAHCDTEGGTEAEVMLPFFRFPAMRKLGGFMLHTWLGAEEPSDRILLKGLEMGSSNITDIDLKNTCAPNGLQNWIRTCKMLETFRLSDGGVNVAENVTNWGKIYRDLCHHKTTLQAISLSDDPDTLEEEQDREVFMGSFADFTSLRILRVPCTGLAQLDDQERPMGRLVELLPSSLEILCICDAHRPSLEWTVDQCECLVNSDAFPNLESICIESNAMTVPNDICKIEALQRRCEKKDISFRVFEPESRKAIEYWGRVWPFDHDFDLW